MSRPKSQASETEVVAVVVDDTPPSSPPPAASLSSSPDSDDSFDFFDSKPDPETDKNLLSSHLERIHVNDGLRDGIAASKGKNVQAGFDEGYMLGAVLGLRCGEILGVLDGVVGALQATPTARKVVPEEEEAAGVETETGNVGKEPEGAKEPVGLSSWKKLQAHAKEELRLEVVCGRSYFGEDGVWKWDTANGAGNKWEESTAATTNTPTTAAAAKREKTDKGDGEGDGDGDGDVTFYDVAAAHPLIIKWAKVVSEEVKKLGMDLGSLNEVTRS